MTIPPEFEEKLKNLSEVYIRAKAAILVAEELNEESKSNLQIILQLRDAFDHTMQAINDLHSESISKTDPIENVNTAIGHVFRATFDAIDGAVLSYKINIIEILKAYPVDVKIKAIKDYSSLMLTLNTINKKIASHRSKKTDENHDTQVFDEYLRTLGTITGIYETILNSQPLLQEISDDKKKKNKKTNRNNILIGLLIAVFGAIIGYLLNA